MSSTELSHQTRSRLADEAAGNEDLNGQRWILPRPARAGNTPSRERLGNQLATIFGIALTLLSIAATLLLFLNPRFDDINRDLARLEQRIDGLETRLANVETGLIQMDSKLDTIGIMIIIANRNGESAATELEAIWRQAGN